MLHSALRQPEGTLKQEIVKEDLDFLGIPAEFQPAFGSAIFSSRFHCLVVAHERRSGLVASLEANRVRLPKLDKLQWRVDVAISTRSCVPQKLTAQRPQTVHASMHPHADDA